MKVHSEVDAGSGYVHTITGTAAKVHDSNEAAKLLRADDEVMYGDLGYLGVSEREEVKNDGHLSQIDYRINQRPSSNKCPKGYKGLNWGKVIEHQKSAVRSKAEHLFLIVKRHFGYKKGCLSRNRKKSTSIPYAVWLGKSSDVYQGQTCSRFLWSITMPIWRSYTQEAGIDR